MLQKRNFGQLINKINTAMVLHRFHGSTWEDLMGSMSFRLGLYVKVPCHQYLSAIHKSPSPT